MADDQGRGWHGDPQGHAQAGAQSSGHTGDTEEHARAGRKGGKASQQSGHAHQLTEEERSEGGQVSSSEQNMSELGRKGGSR